MSIYYFAGTVDAVYNDLPDAMMARVSQFPTLLWLPLTADQPTNVPDEQNPASVRKFVAERRTPAGDVTIQQGSDATARPPRAVPLWEHLPANLAGAVAGQKADITEMPQEPHSGTSVRENQKRAQREREEAQAEKVFAAMNLDQAVPTQAEKILSVSESRPQARLNTADGAGPGSRSSRPGQWKVRAVWCVVCVLMLILLVDCIHPLKPYINPSDDESEAEDEVRHRRRAQKGPETKEKAS